MTIEEIILKRQIDFNNNWPTEKEGRIPEASAKLIGIS